MNRQEKLKNLREEFPEGTVIELIHMDDPQAPPAGTKGVVQSVDGIGTIHVRWKNGSSLGLIPGVDEFRKAAEQPVRVLNFTGNSRPAYVICCDSCGNTSVVASDHKRYCPVCGPHVITPIEVTRYSDFIKGGAL